MAAFSVDVVGKPAGFIVKLSGRAGGPESEQLEEQLNRLVALKPQMIVVDMTGLEYLSSMGVSALIRLHRSMKEAGGKTALASVPDAMLKLLQSVKLDNLMPIYGKAADALP
ncbi:MAG: STAS domain-containing protein [Planctomycetota bacterium]|nr:STAS domain-containing protein [Planctomycetota bacterium]